MKKLIKSALMAGIAVTLTTQVNAVVISYALNGIGYWDPGSNFNSSSDPYGVFDGIKHSVDVWNGAAEGTFGPTGPPDKSADFTRGSGTAVPAALNPPTAFLGQSQITSGGWTFDNSAGDYSFLTAKYGDRQYAYYVGNLLSTIEFSSTGLNGNGLSHVSTFSGGGPQDTPRVPDGGTTLAALGLSLLGLGSMRRFLIKKA